MWVFPWMQQLSGFGIRVWNAYQYNAIAVFAMSLCLLLGFQGLRIRADGKPARLLVAIAPYAFGVYLIHTHPALKLPIWLDFIGLPRLYGSPWLLPVILLVTPALFLLLCGVDWLRAQLMRLTGLDRLMDRLCDGAEKRVRSWLMRLAPDADGAVRGAGQSAPLAAQPVMETPTPAFAQGAGEPAGAAPAAETAPTTQPEPPQRG